MARAHNLSIIMGQPAGWLLGSYGRRCWAGGAEIWQDSQAGRQQCETAFGTTASLTNRGQEDIEIMYGIISRTSCSENKALEKKAG